MEKLYNEEKRKVGEKEDQIYAILNENEAFMVDNGRKIDQIVDLEEKKRNQQKVITKLRKENRELKQKNKSTHDVSKLENHIKELYNQLNEQYEKENLERDYLISTIKNICKENDDLRKEHREELEYIKKKYKARTDNLNKIIHIRDEKIKDLSSKILVLKQKLAKSRDFEIEKYNSLQEKKRILKEKAKMLAKAREKRASSSEYMVRLSSSVMSYTSSESSSEKTTNDT